MKKYKILHFVPAYNEQINANVAAQTHRDHASTYDAGHQWAFSSRHSCDLVWLRNTTLDRAIQQGYDYLVMQDADVYSGVPDGPVMALLDTAIKTGATITSPIVSLRTNPRRAGCWPVYPGEVYEAEKVGTGLVLIDCNKIREWYADYKGPCFARTYDTDKGVNQQMGLDVFFSYVVRQHGGTIVIDGRIPTTHIDSCTRLEFDGHDVAESTGTEPAVTG